MIDAFQALTNALAYATFEDDDIEEKTTKLVETLNNELYAAGFEPSVPIENATTDLNDALDAADEEDENEPVVKVEEEDSEFAGLGEDDED